MNMGLNPSSIATAGFQLTQVMELNLMGKPLKYAYILETSTCIDLASNALTDAIPTGIGNLGGLNYLYLPKYGLPGVILLTIGNPLQLSGTI